MNNYKFRIINKSSDGVIISVSKNAEPTKMSWEDFKRDFVIRDKVWAVPTDEYANKLDEIEKHLNSATTAYIAASNPSTEAGSALTWSAVLGGEIQKIADTAGITVQEVMLLLKKRVQTAFSTLYEKPKKKHHRNKEMSADSDMTSHYRPRKEKQESICITGEKKPSGNLLSDNPALQALKNKFKKGEK